MKIELLKNLNIDDKYNITYNKFLKFDIKTDSEYFFNRIYIMYKYKFAVLFNQYKKILLDNEKKNLKLSEFKNLYIFKFNDMQYKFISTLDNSNNNLFISNIGYSYLNNVKNKFDLIFISNINNINLLKKYKIYNIKNLNNFYPTIEYGNNLEFINKLKKYDNINIYPIKGGNFLYYSIYHYILNNKIINYLLISLKLLNKDGNIVIMLPLFKNNNVINKLIQLLYDKFENVKYSLVKEYFYYNRIFFECKKFKGLSKNEIELFDKILNKLLDNVNDVNVDDILFYKYYLETEENNNNLYFKFDKIKKEDYKTEEEKEMYKIYKEKLKDIRENKKIYEDKTRVIIDIDLKEPTKKTESLINLLEYYYNLYINEYKFGIARFISEDNKIVDINEFNEHNKNLMIKYIKDIFKFLEENNIPYNKSYFKKLKEFNDKKIENLFTLINYYKQHLVKYKSFKNPKIKPNLSPYTYDELNNYHNKMDMLLITKNRLLDALKIDREPNNIKIIDEGLTRGIARYITANYKLKYPISNGFIKLWEIYNSDEKILPIKEKINVFHMAEAPGQWIHATDHYIYSRMLKYEKQQETIYNWYANALNPYNPKNIALYGKDLFKDNYGFIGKFPDRWLYGADNTGDITSIKNIKWFKQFLSDKFPSQNEETKLHLITGDAGIKGDLPLYISQRLDLAQVVMVLSCLSEGGNCVIKHFLPYVASIPESSEGSGLYVNIIYLYYCYFDKVKLIKPKSSNQLSGEFYVIGLDFKGIKQHNLELLYTHLKNIKNNECFYEKDNLPNKFVKQVLNFFIELNQVNIENKEIRLDLLNCIIEKDDKVFTEAMNCKKYLNFKWSKDILEQKIKTWIAENLDHF